MRKTSTGSEWEEMEAVTYRANQVGNASCHTTWLCWVNMLSSLVVCCFNLLLKIIWQIDK